MYVLISKGFSCHSSFSWLANESAGWITLADGRDIYGPPMAMYNKYAIQFLKNSSEKKKKK